MTAPLVIVCRLIKTAIKQAVTATRPIRRYRPARRVGRVAGVATVKTTAIKVVWVCLVTGPLLVPPGSVGPTAGELDRQNVDQAAPSTGSTSPLAFLPLGVGTDEFFTLPPGHAADLSLPPGTVEIVISPPGGFAFVSVPDCCVPAPTQPGPEQPQPPTTPVPEPASLVLLATGFIVTAFAWSRS
jgi:hypothetical protein